MQSSLLAKPATPGAFVYSSVSQMPAYCLPRSFRAVMTRSRSLPPTSALSHLCVLSINCFLALLFSDTSSVSCLQADSNHSPSYFLSSFAYLPLPSLYFPNFFLLFFWRGEVSYSLPPSLFHFPPFASSLLFLPKFGENNFKCIFFL